MMLEKQNSSLIWCDYILYVCNLLKAYIKGSKAITTDEEDRQ